MTTVEQAAAYRQRILAGGCPAGLKFDLLMTLYLTDTSSPEEIGKAEADSGFGRRQTLLARHHQLGRRCLRHRSASTPSSNGWPNGAWFSQAWRGDSW